MPDINRAALRQLVPSRVQAALVLGAGIVLCALLWQRLAQVDAAAVLDGTRDLPAALWWAAAGFSCLSFWALGRYDGVIHRELGTGIDPDSAHRAGITAIALSQTLGFGILTGALVRWRMLPGLSPLAALRLSVAVALNFLLVWALITACVLLVTVSALPLSAALAISVALIAGVVTFLVIHPRPGFGRFRLRLPTVSAFAALLALGALDTLAAAAALWSLLPPGTGIGLIEVLPAFLLALGAGMVSGAPAGAGAFELTLLAALPGHAAVQVLAAIVAFRIIYFALPACLAMLLLAVPGRAVATPDMPNWPVHRMLPRDLPAEAGLVRQGGALLPSPDGPLAVKTGAQVCALVAEPAGGVTRAGLDALATAAAARNRLPCLYKCGPRSAARARRAGWAVMPVAEDAVIDLPAFTLEGSATRQLRRQLRKAEAAGLFVERAEAPLPWAEMDRINTAWARAHGGERGFSMGRFDPAYLAGQEVWLARTGDTLRGFASFHRAGDGLCLDLMRGDPEAPAGLMQALVAAAAKAGRDAGLVTLSLAAAPLDPQGATGPMRRLRTVWQTRAGGPGLRRFKQSFAPRWSRRYLAASGWPALTLAAADIAREIHRPAPLPADRAGCAAHEDHEAYGFASRAAL